MLVAALPVRVRYRAGSMLMLIAGFFFVVMYGKRCHSFTIYPRIWGGNMEPLASHQLLGAPSEAVLRDE